VSAVTLELAAWRAVATFADVREAVGALREALTPRCGGAALLRWDASRARLEPISAWGTLEGLVPQGLPTPRRDAFLAWSTREGEGRWPERGVDSVARMLFPDDVVGAVAATCLSSGEGLLGVLLVSGAVEDEVLEVLRTPLSVALARDAERAELLRLREASDAERDALRRRLAREDVSEAIVGADAGLRQVMHRVGQVAPTDAPVLVLGETGSGKEVVARAIHAGSRRAKGPFLRVNCGAIPPELVDSELFGHEKGSFTGAIATRKGWFERADGGTLFLDELGELPAAAQVRLLRVLQDGSFERVGGQRSLRADVRLVAATHRDIAGDVRAGRFREDLWYRVSVFPIDLPALRERRGDIGALAAHFAARAGERLGGRPLAVTVDDVERLSSYTWPGNVRELAAVIERAAILGSGRRLEVGLALGGAFAPPTGVGRPDSGASAKASKPGAEDAAALEEAVAACLGRIEGPFGAAARLGVNPHTLRARMRRLGVDWARYRRSTG
jgi:transcriptional regulator with GAF, ATPase, and Fis domain